MSLITLPRVEYYTTRYFFSVSLVFWAIFIILAFIGYSSFYKGTNGEQRLLSRYKQSQLQGKVPGSYDDNERERPWQEESLQELSQYAEADVTLTEADKPNLQHALVDQDRRLPFKKMFANGGEKDKKGENH